MSVYPSLSICLVNFKGFLYFWRLDYFGGGKVRVIRHSFLLQQCSRWSLFKVMECFYFVPQLFIFNLNYKFSFADTLDLANEHRQSHQARWHMCPTFSFIHCLRRFGLTFSKFFRWNCMQTHTHMGTTSEVAQWFQFKEFVYVAWKWLLKLFFCFSVGMNDTDVLLFYNLFRGITLSSGT